MYTTAASMNVQTERANTVHTRVEVLHDALEHLALLAGQVVSLGHLRAGEAGVAVGVVRLLRARRLGDELAVEEA